ncbi:MAG: peptidylprolyl isomerase [Tissierellia bacterium]|nr:peptidylprolyl isomerase [Tissierellia bacterium]
MTEQKEKKLVAEVNGKKITEEDVVTYLQGMNPQFAQQFRSEDGIKQVIEELVRQELLYFDALEKNLDQEEEFVKVLNQTKESLLKSYAFSKVLESVQIEDQDIEDFYEKNKKLFEIPETAQASHILVDNEDLAKDIRAKLDEGAAFEDLAREHSTCPSKEKGGDLGLFYPGQMVPEFDQAVFSMEEGEISDPVKTQFGYHIIRLDHKFAEQKRTLDEARQDVRTELLRQKQQAAYQEKVDELSEKYPVKLY